MSEYVSFTAENSQQIGILGIILYILLIIAYWKIFQKAGEPGFKSLIPVYNVYTQYRFSWGTRPFLWLLVCLIAGFALPQIAPDSDFWAWVARTCLTLAGIIRLFALYRLSRCFGHGILFTIGLYFLPNLFLLILGFGSSRYRGA